MAGCSKKQYAIMMGSGDEGKKLAAKMGSMEQEEFNKAFSELLQSDAATDITAQAEAEGDKPEKYRMEDDEDYGDFDPDDDSEWDEGEDDLDRFDNDRKANHDEIYNFVKTNYDGIIKKDAKITKEQYYDILEGIENNTSDEFADADTVLENLLEDYNITVSDDEEKQEEQIEYANRNGIKWIDTGGKISFEKDGKWVSADEFMAGEEEIDFTVKTEENLRKAVNTAFKNGQSPQRVLDTVSYDFDLEPGSDDFNKLKEIVKSYNVEQSIDTFNPNNPKYKGFERSDITNAKEVNEGYTYTNSKGKKVKMSIIEYTPYGALQDGDNTKLYGVVKNYDGSDAPKIGAIVTSSLENAKEQLESQVKLDIQGSDRYSRRGKYDEEYFNIIRDNREDGDDEEYKERYGWDFNKPFAEHDFMKDDPYEKWKSERELRKTQLQDELNPEYQEKKSEDRKLFNALGQAGLGLSVNELNDVVAYIRTLRDKK